MFANIVFHPEILDHNNGKYHSMLFLSRVFHFQSNMHAGRALCNFNLVLRYQGESQTTKSARALCNFNLCLQY
jgi:hypothetical protein